MKPEQEIASLYDRLQSAHEQLESARAGEAETLEEVARLTGALDIERALLASSDHDAFVCGEEAGAAAERARIVGLLEAELGRLRFASWAEGLEWAIREIKRGEP